MNFRPLDILALALLLAFLAAWVVVAHDEAVKGGQWPIPPAGRPL